MIVKDLKHIEEMLLRVPFKSGRIGLPRSKSNILNNYRICDGKYLVKQVNATNKSTVQRFMLGKLKVSLWKENTFVLFRHLLLARAGARGAAAVPRQGRAQRHHGLPSG